MQRKDFLKRVGMSGIIIPLVAACSKNDPTPSTHSTTSSGSSSNSSSGSSNSTTCAVTDTETDGPYPLYNSRGSSIQRNDITDGKTGLPLSMTLTVKSVKDNCNILTNARVDVWHCDKDGYYSGYTNSGYLGTQDNSAKVFCRGLQFTDANGQAKFATIYPGWYTGRVTHVHVQIYVSNVLKLTSQFAFPEDINTAVYKTSLYSSHGQNSTKNSTDSIISDSLTNELASVVLNAATGGYDLAHTIYVSV